MRRRVCQRARWFELRHRLQRDRRDLSDRQVQSATKRAAEQMYLDCRSRCNRGPAPTGQPRQRQYRQRPSRVSGSVQPRGPSAGFRDPLPARRTRGVDLLTRNTGTTIGLPTVTAPLETYPRMGEGAPQWRRRRACSLLGAPDRWSCAATKPIAALGAKKRTPFLVGASRAKQDLR